MLLGKQSTLEVHHIFPKALLYKHGYSKAEVNALANYSFQTKACNLEISNKNPEDYLKAYINKNPSAVFSHWIPENPALYTIENYLEFLAQRRLLLAEHANAFLDSLLANEDQVNIEDYAHRAMDEVTVSDVPAEEEEEAILSTSIWMEEQGLNPGIMNFEMLDDEDRLLTVVDLAWPEGIQTGLSEPVALLLKEPVAIQNLMNEQGYRYFTDLDKFRKYAAEHIELV